MPRLSQPIWLRLAGLLALLAAPSAAFAHSFYERYDLPIPLHVFAWGAGTVVGLSFVLMAFVSKTNSPTSEPALSLTTKAPTGVPYWLNRAAIVMARTLGLTLFALAIATGLWGTGNPLMNFAPAFIWIIWWVGFSFLVIGMGNVWPRFDPWLTLFQAVPRGLVRQRPWPRGLAMYPAVFLLLLWCWLEVVYPIALVPYKLGAVLLLWTVIQLLGMAFFGQTVWQSKADVFAIYFAMLGRLRRGGFDKTDAAQGFSFVAFILAMLSTVIFDGLHSHSAWTALEEGLERILPTVLAQNAYTAGTMGIVGVWLVFALAHYTVCWQAVRAVRLPYLSTGQLASQLAPSLLPIAAAYLVAHHFSSFVIQGQSIFFLISDPFAWGWDVFGSNAFQPRTEIIDAQFTWYLAIASIVIGHIWAIWKAHQTALRLAQDVADSPMNPAQNALTLTFPMTIWMVLLTMLSLLILAEPLLTG